MDLPRIVISVRDGVVTAVYHDDLETAFVVYDHDQEDSGEEPISVDYTLPFSELEPHEVAAIRRVFEGGHLP